MKPIHMNPAYRHGSMTPWGSDALRTVYGRNIPEDITGEALECSAISGFESCDDNGNTLSELIALYDVELTGPDYVEEFPLLLKLLSAKTPLSVQVHPDDDYARLHEGKLGKTEAWVILKAEKGASLLYGMKEGVTKERIEKALTEGDDVEPLIQRVNVHPGDVYFMPSGMVHAIGGGILLYEIQQSSDVTYRLWDYNRTDAEGNKRPLHIRQSVDVIRPELKGEKAFLPEKGQDELVELLNVPAFSLWGILVEKEMKLPATADRFGILTVLNNLTLVCESEERSCSAGDTLLIPAKCSEVWLKGTGRALLSRPGDKKK